MQPVEIEQLVDDCGGAVYRFCRSMTRSQIDADDLYQQTFLRAMELHGAIDGNRNPKGYLLSLAVGIWRNALRKEARHQRILPVTAATEEEWQNAASGSESIDEEVVAKELKTAVNGIVQQLDEKLRVAVVLYYTVSLPVQEIAGILKLPQGTIKSRLHKARCEIKKRLEALGYEGT